MSLPVWREEAITKHHRRETFNCGNDKLNAFLQKYARKSHKKGGAKTFLTINNNNNTTILGFYSISPASITYARAPEIIKRKLARHDIPVFRLSRLAVDVRYQGKGFSGQLLLSAGRRCLLVAAEVGGVALLIDAKHKQGARWYQRFSAAPLLDTPLSLLLPFKTIHAALVAAKKL